MSRAMWEQGLDLALGGAVHIASIVVSGLWITDFPHASVNVSNKAKKMLSDSFRIPPSVNGTPI